MRESYFSGDHLLTIWLWSFLLVALVVGITKGFFKARKIQPKGFKWMTLRNEAAFAIINVFITGLILGNGKTFLTEHGWISFNDGPASWWVIAFEYALYFILFDTYFYWLHRWMHRPSVYRWIHKLHHRSVSPNLLTTLSVSPLESVINGGFVPLFLTVFTVHDASMALIMPTNILMGLYVHSGYEFMPRWWNRSWATKWFITATFHDQHHRFFTGNYGGYTTIWDRLCGTMRTRFEADFDKIKARSNRTPAVTDAELAG